VLFVTLHGGHPGKSPHKNNVHAYGKDGEKITPCVLEDIDGVTLDELRGIYLVGKFLYVVNANKTQNSVLAFQGSGTSYKFAGKVVSNETCKGVLHPFDLTFDGAGYCYISSQDTNVVTRLKLSPDGKTAAAAPIAPALPAQGKFLPGTFIASSVGSLSEPATTPIPAPAGLQYCSEGAKKHSVRGVLWTNNALYVADEPAGIIKAYDANGKFLGESNKVESPVHLVAHQGSLYVSGANQVLTGKLTKPARNFTLSPIPDLKIKNGGAMAFTPEDHFYIASRTENYILKFDANFKPIKFDCTLPDNPEFLLHV
jgi:hypothetical protein